MDRKRTFAIAGALVGLACTVQAWTIGRAVVPAQDSIRYLIVAQAMARDGLLTTLRTQREQPLFPALVCLSHTVLQRAGMTDETHWAASLQLAAALPLVLAVVPVYLLFRRLVGPRAALCGGVFFCLAGNLARLGADGLADSTHLLFFFLALWAATEYFVSPSARPAWLALAGVFIGIALLARAEAIVIPPAVAATLAWRHWTRARRPSLAATAAAASTLALGALGVVAPFLAVCGETRFDGALARVLGRQGAIEARPLNVPFSHQELRKPVESHWYLEGEGWLSFGRKDFSLTSRVRGWPAAIREFAVEIGKAFQYWLGGLALLGLWRLRARRARAVDRLAQFAAAILTGASLYVAATSGYLSSRHLLALLVLGLGCAGAGVIEVANWCAIAARRAAPALWWVTLSRSGAMFLACAACTPALARPLHASRAGHRQAAEWLARHAAGEEVVLDSRGWTSLYTGLVTYRYEAAQTAMGDPKLAYVVVEQEELDADSRRGETLRLLAGQAMEPLARFAAQGAKDKQQVVVHRWHPDRFRQLEERIHAR
ncbi:MAG TPA: glycosyltransferase family 39 protein [Pirellulales bacterium]|nr:glycosyltransferase family 39 protein [Pirellulales bacterium]